MMFIICILMMCVCLFFFKQKTSYELRISDWSSDVCSSDLIDAAELAALRNAHLVAVVARQPWVIETVMLAVVAQRPDMRDLAIADRMQVAGRVGPVLVFGRRDPRPAPRAIARRPLVAHTGPDDRPPTRRPV